MYCLLVYLDLTVSQRYIQEPREVSLCFKDSGLSCATSSSRMTVRLGNTLLQVARFEIEILNSLVHEHTMLPQNGITGVSADDISMLCRPPLIEKIQKMKCLAQPCTYEYVNKSCFLSSREESFVTDK